PPDVDAVAAQLLVVDRDVRPAAGAADADRRRVLAEDQGAGGLGLAQVVDEAALEELGLVEVDQAEQVNLERRGETGRHVQSFSPRSWHRVDPPGAARGPGPV